MTSLSYNDAIWTSGEVIFHQNKCISHTIRASSVFGWASNFSNPLAPKPI